MSIKANTSSGYLASILLKPSIFEQADFLFSIQPKTMISSHPTDWLNQGYLWLCWTSKLGFNWTKQQVSCDDLHLDRLTILQHTFGLSFRKNALSEFIGKDVTQFIPVLRRVKAHPP